MIDRGSFLIPDNLPLPLTLLFAIFLCYWVCNVTQFEPPRLEKPKIRVCAGQDRSKRRSPNHQLGWRWLRRDDTGLALIWQVL
ncbi:uncharacterized protein BO72DRAFT_45178 [Aspergillus fijiensis CBS 313.89]|uniref:Uncharacterized protein n=1 Tax=Aspergillus fijiensis CBS 313.89 TaxID=1448319 RepID=A0A8G1W3T9_9EURO|nr:uncharacterized protein BO72DRAFT_45178 [Aspergillus fijiensis CBS 313.89]RAK79459.1 hypothetical protein BO72DRAFT_45178 [Aspergillus fijiensis CBS 313.89]